MRQNKIISTQSSTHAPVQDTWPIIPFTPENVPDEAAEILSFLNTAELPTDPTIANTYMRKYYVNFACHVFRRPNDPVQSTYFELGKLKPRLTYVLTWLKAQAQEPNISHEPAPLTPVNEKKLKDEQKKLWETLDPLVEECLDDPLELSCVLSQCLFENPVQVTIHGHKHVYEYSFAFQWISQNGTDPNTRAPITTSALDTPDEGMKKAVLEFKQNTVPKIIECLNKALDMSHPKAEALFEKLQEYSATITEPGVKIAVLKASIRYHTRKNQTQDIPTEQRKLFKLLLDQNCLDEAKVLWQSIEDKTALRNFIQGLAGSNQTSHSPEQSKNLSAFFALLGQISEQNHDFESSETNVRQAYRLAPTEELLERLLRVYKCRIEHIISCGENQPALEKLEHLMVAQFQSETNPKIRHAKFKIIMATLSGYTIAQKQTHVANLYKQQGDMQNAIHQHLAKWLGKKNGAKIEGIDAMTTSLLSLSSHISAQRDIEHVMHIFMGLILIQGKHICQGDAMAKQLITFGHLSSSKKTSAHILDMLEQLTSRANTSACASQQLSTLNISTWSSQQVVDTFTLLGKLAQQTKDNDTIIQIATVMCPFINACSDTALKSEIERFARPFIPILKEALGPVLIYPNTLTAERCAYIACCFSTLNTAKLLWHQPGSVLPGLYKNTKSFVVRQFLLQAACRAGALDKIYGENILAQLDEFVAKINAIKNPKLLLQKPELKYDLIMFYQLALAISDLTQPSDDTPSLLYNAADSIMTHVRSSYRAIMSHADVLHQLIPELNNRSIHEVSTRLVFQLSSHITPKEDGTSDVSITLHRREFQTYLTMYQQSTSSFQKWMVASTLAKLTSIKHNALQFEYSLMLGRQNIDLKLTEVGASFFTLFSEAPTGIVLEQFCQVFINLYTHHAKTIWNDFLSLFLLIHAALTINNPKTKNTILSLVFDVLSKAKTPINFSGFDIISPNETTETTKTAPKPTRYNRRPNVDRYRHKNPNLYGLHSALKIPKNQGPKYGFRRMAYLRASIIHALIEKLLHSAREPIGYKCMAAMISEYPDANYLDASQCLEALQTIDDESRDTETTLWVAKAYINLLPIKPSDLPSSINLNQFLQRLRPHAKTLASKAWILERYIDILASPQGKQRVLTNSFSELVALVKSIYTHYRSNKIDPLSTPNQTFLKKLLALFQDLLPVNANMKPFLSPDMAYIYKSMVYFTPLESLSFFKALTQTEAGKRFFTQQHYMADLSSIISDPFTPVSPVELNDLTGLLADITNPMFSSPPYLTYSNGRSIAQPTPFHINAKPSPLASAHLYYKDIASALRAHNNVGDSTKEAPKRKSMENLSRLLVHLAMMNMRLRKYKVPAHNYFDIYFLAGFLLHFSKLNLSEHSLRNLVMAMRGLVQCDDGWTDIRQCKLPVGDIWMRCASAATQLNTKIELSISLRALLQRAEACQPKDNYQKLEDRKSYDDFCSQFNQPKHLDTLLSFAQTPDAPALYQSLVETVYVFLQNKAYDQDVFLKETMRFLLIRAGQTAQTDAHRQQIQALTRFLVENDGKNLLNHTGMVEMLVRLTMGTTNEDIKQESLRILAVLKGCTYRMVAFAVAQRLKRRSAVLPT